MSAHFKLSPAHRAAVEDQIESLIAMLDAFDGDTDLEPEVDRCTAGDDGCGAFYAGYGDAEWGSLAEHGGTLKPAYSIDQTAGPINYQEASNEHRAAEMGLVRSSSGGWTRPS